MKQHPIQEYNLKMVDKNKERMKLLKDGHNFVKGNVVYWIMSQLKQNNQIFDTFNIVRMEDSENNMTGFTFSLKDDNNLYNSFVEILFFNKDGGNEVCFADKVLENKNKYTKEINAFLEFCYKSGFVFTKDLFTCEPEERLGVIWIISKTID